MLENRRGKTKQLYFHERRGNETKLKTLDPPVTPLTINALRVQQSTPYYILDEPSDHQETNAWTPATVDKISMQLSK